MELVYFEVPILKSMERRLPHALDCLVYPSMSKNLARLPYRSLRVHLTLARLCDALWNVHGHRSSGKALKRIIHLAHHPHFLLMQRRHHEMATR